MQFRIVTVSLIAATLGLLSTSIVPAGDEPAATIPVETPPVTPQPTWTPNPILTLKPFLIAADDTPQRAYTFHFDHADKALVIANESGQGAILPLEPDAKPIAIGNPKPYIVNTPKVALVLGAVMCLDGSKIASYSLPGPKHQPAILTIWDGKTGKVDQAIDTKGEEVWDLASHGDLVAAACKTGDTLLWNVAKGEIAQRLSGQAGPIEQLKFIRQGSQIATLGKADVQVWETTSGKKVRSLSFDEKGMHAMAISPDDKVIAIAFGDGSLRQWNLETGESLRKIQVFKSGECIARLTWSLDGQWLAGVSTEGQVSVWKSHSLENALQLDPKLEFLSGLSLLPGGLVLYTSRRRATACLRSVPANKEIARFQCDAQALSSDGKRLAVYRNGEITIWPTPDAATVAKTDH